MGEGVRAMACGRPLLSADQHPIFPDPAFQFYKSVNFIVLLQKFSKNKTLSNLRNLLIVFRYLTLLVNMFIDFQFSNIQHCGT